MTVKKIIIYSKKLIIYQTVIYLHIFLHISLFIALRGGIAQKYEAEERKQEVSAAHLVRMKVNFCVRVKYELIRLNASNQPGSHIGMI